MTDARYLLDKIRSGDHKSLARAISIVENESNGYKDILFSLEENKPVPVIGFTGPPGAGKSTLINSVVSSLIKQGKKIAVIAIDPTSPFNFGSLLGDRVRMAELFNHPNVFIRSLATRGSLGGMSEKIIEVTDVIKAADFDFIFIETVGVGQSEVEIAGLADTTIVVFVPESGDEIQTLKSGIMEIADIFVVNKCDREGADRFATTLLQLVHSHKMKAWNVPVVKTSALNKLGIDELITQINKHQSLGLVNEKKIFLLAEKAYRLIQKLRMGNVSKEKLKDEMVKLSQDKNFNIYRFTDQYSAK